jgi:peptide/nickel transport system permease protein
MSLRGYIIKRLAYTFVLVIFVIIINWIIFQAIPGGSGAIANLGGGTKQSNSQYLYYERLYGLDKPPLVRFENYFWDMLTFNFGNSFNTQHPVIDDMISSGRLVNTLLLVGSATALSLVLGVVLGVVISSRRGGVADNFWVTSSLATFSLPVFWLGLILITIFAFTLNWFPAGGSFPADWAQFGVPPWPQMILGRLQYLVLPMLTLVLIIYGGNLLLTRATMMEALNEDYIVTARAKGLKERTVLFKHALKNASLPIVTTAALGFGTVLGGAILTESVFTWKGLGYWLFQSIGYKDFPVMQAMFYILALSVIFANLVSDLVYGIIDPRIRYE